MFKDFSNAFCVLVTTFLLAIAPSSKVFCQYHSPEYYYKIFDSYQNGNVILINSSYAILMANSSKLDVYSLKSGLFVKSFTIPVFDEPFSTVTYFSPSESNETKVKRYFAQYHGNITDPALLPEPDWKVLFADDYKIKQSDDGLGYDVILQNGSKLFFPVENSWQRGTPHYCKARNSLVISSSFKTSPYMVDLKIFGLIEVNSKGEITNHIPDPLTSASNQLVFGSRMVLQDRIYDLASKTSYSLSGFGNKLLTYVHDNHILVCYNYENESNKSITLIDLNHNTTLLRLENVYSPYILSADLKSYMKYEVNQESHGTRGFVTNLDNNTIVELICPEATVDYNDDIKSKEEYEKRIAFNLSLFRDFKADEFNRMKKFNDISNTFISESKTLGWTLVQELQSPSVELTPGDFSIITENPADSLAFDDTYFYWIVNVSALPFVEARINFYGARQGFSFLSIGEMGYGIDYTHDYGLTHTGLIHPNGKFNFNYLVDAQLPFYLNEAKVLPAGTTRCLVFRKKANDKSFELPAFNGTNLPVYYMHDFDERYETAIRNHHEFLRAEAERIRIETLKRIPTFQGPQPGSALYNLQMQIDAAVPSTWATCNACGGSGVSSSKCQCCSGRGSIAVKRQVFHRMSEKTDEVYRPNGAQGAGYYIRTSPVGYYKTETGYESCKCCDGAGLISGQGVCTNCGGAGRVK